MNVILITGAVFVATTSPAQAHNVNLIYISANFEPDGRYQISVFDDVKARLAGVLPGHLTEQAIQEYLALSPEDRRTREEKFCQMVRRRVKAYFDGQPAACRIDLPERYPEGAKSVRDALWPARFIRLRGTIPPHAASFQLFCSKSFGNVILTLQQADSPPVIQRVEMGARSDPFPLNRPPPVQSALAVTRSFIALGFTHILPLGWDHIAFVLCLFLLSTHLRPLLWQVTAFTVAHSITLSLAVLHVVSLTSAVIAHVVEPLIALSIAFVAIENVFTDKLKPRRLAVVFLFGLLHGLGFASVLLRLGIPTGQYLNALASFNVGVELGQLAVIAIATALLVWFQKAAWYRRRIVIPASSLIALIGLVVALQRFIA